MSKFRYLKRRVKRNIQALLMSLAFGIAVVYIIDSPIFDPFQKMIDNIWFSFSNFFIILSLMIGFLLIIRFVFYVRHKIRLRKSKIHDIDSMSGADFEEFMYGFFKRKGLKVRKTKHTGDFGADLIIEQDEQVYVIQLKRYRSKIGVDAIQQVYASKNVYKATRAMVITNSLFTDAAKKLAKENEVELWDRYRLIKELAS